jgi:orotate phosphoribosyltransferase
MTPYHRLPDALAAHHFGRAAVLAAWHLEGRRDLGLEAELGALYGAFCGSEVEHADVHAISGGTVDHIARALSTSGRPLSDRNAPGLYWCSTTSGQYDWFVVASSMLGARLFFANAHACVPSRSTDCPRSPGWGRRRMAGGTIVSYRVPRAAGTLVPAVRVLTPTRQVWRSLPTIKGPAMEPRSILLDLLAIHAYQYSPEDFLLASGKRSNEYFDCKMALSRPQAMAVLGAVIHGRLYRDVVAVGGLTMGSDPIANSTCQYSATTDHPVSWFSVRKDAKEHGRKKLIEGNVREGDFVAVVDDVVTTGASTVQAIQACRRQGLVVRQVLVLVDRQQDEGLRNIGVEADCEVQPIFTKSQIKAAWERLQTRETS